MQSAGTSPTGACANTDAQTSDTPVVHAPKNSRRRETTLQRLVIGSTAAPTVLNRSPVDLDVFSPDPNAGEDVIWHPDFSTWITPGTNRLATLNELYTIKISHAYWELKNGSWLKHMSDTVRLQDAGAELIQPLHDLLYKVWTSVHGPKRVNLGLESDQFFKDAVVRLYDHDSLHRSVAYGDHPLYEDVLQDGHSVKTDMARVRALSFADKIRLYREEVYATALERIIIPSNYKHSPRHAYAWALRRTITSLTRGWSAQFLAENYKTMRTPDIDYVALHLSNTDKLEILV